MRTAVEKIYAYGLRKFTMDEIASELKISKKTIYKYFRSKDEIIVEYFDETVESDKKNTLEAIKKDCPLPEKINDIIYSYHKYRLPASVIDEVHKFYYDEWLKIQELRKFKIKKIEEILIEAKNMGKLKPNVELHIVSSILESISDTFLDYKFLSENNITMKEAMKSVLNILLYGILK